MNPLHDISGRALAQRAQLVLQTDDDLVCQLIRPPVEPLHGAAARDAYDSWRRAHFFRDW